MDSEKPADFGVWDFFYRLVRHQGSAADDYENHQTLFVVLVQQ